MTFRHSFKKDFRLLNIISISTIGAIVFFTILVVLYNYNKEAFLHGHFSQKFFFPATILLTCAGLLVARYIYRGRMDCIHIDTYSVKDRIEQYKTILCLHHGICSIPAILSIICFLLFANYFYLLFISGVLIEIGSKYPRDEKINDAINLLNFK